MENDVLDDNAAEVGCGDNNANIFHDGNAEGVLKRDHIARNLV